ncbi:MAG: hypothetical protein JXA89_23135 [Anaerolineae bacterium]|nr:hypothetical protein [Anaerolineae bacterium]
MADFQITMRRSPGLSEAERQRRIKMAFDAILGFSLTETDPGDEFGDQAPGPVQNTAGDEPDAQTIIHTNEFSRQRR